ncbi:MAG: hypothetical protein EXR92_04265 [Gemmatimonadetes bacterium]|nr:hypothetical protein [Gemmatimonadota bacterium]
MAKIERRGAVTLHPLEGHEDARAAVLRAFLAGHLPSVLLLHGPTGVGKQRFALWIGQLLLCEQLQPSGPCGGCHACILALRVEHPDLHWYFPVPRPPARGSPERDQEALEEVRSERLAQRRETPLRPSYSDEVQGLHFATIRNLRREASRRPGMGPRRLFLVADAEALVAQESAQEAANALLKVLEEPPTDTWFVLTASEPGRLLPTVRSRASPLYLPPLPVTRVREFLRREWSGAGEAEIEKAAELSGGAIGRALGFLKDGEDEGPLERTRQEAFFLLRAALDPEAAGRFSRALEFDPFGARSLHEILTLLETWMRDLAAVAAGAETPILNVGAREWLSRTAGERDLHALPLARAVQVVEAARERAAGNVNPQLIVAHLLLELNDALVNRTGRVLAASQSEVS